jgi:hypothetical protein
MTRPNWEYIRVDVRLPRHPKLDGARSGTKWTLIELWLHCGEHLTDGYVRNSVWLAIGTANAMADLVKRGLARRVRGGYQMHDYLEWNRSRAEVEELIEHRRAAGSRGGKAKASARANAKASAVAKRKQTSSKPVPEAEAEAEAEAEQNHTTAEVIHSNVEVSPPAAQNGQFDYFGAERHGTPAEEAERKRQMDALMRLAREEATP